jgi:hypothetical protein
MRIWCAKEVFLLTEQKLSFGIFIVWQERVGALQRSWVFKSRVENLDRKTESHTYEVKNFAEPLSFSSFSL